MKSLLGLVFGLVIFPFSAYAEGKVADEIQFKIDDGYTEIEAGTYLWLPLQLKTDARIEIFLDVQNATYDDLSVFICDEQNLMLLRNDRPSKCWGVHRQKDNFVVSGNVILTSPHYLVFSNTFSVIVKKKASYSVYATIPTPWQMAHEFEQSMSALSSEISKAYGIEEFDITLMPCGHENAYSVKETGNIEICSELFMELGRSQKTGTLLAILFHELGHTLLNKLGLPNWDNEEAVDEFALYLLYQANKQELAISWIEWNESRSTKTELTNRLLNDVRHPLSIQRARNIRRLINSPKELSDRWNNLLYPYMADHALEDIIQKRPPYSDVNLAVEILASRN